jgi:hypothetical protein
MASSVEDSRRLITCVGTLFRASQFLSEELPIRLAHRVQDLGELPDGLSEMPSIKKVQDWYAQSFEVCLLYPLFFFFFTCGSILVARCCFRCSVA